MKIIHTDNYVNFLSKPKMVLGLKKNLGAWVKKLNYIVKYDFFFVQGAIPILCQQNEWVRKIAIFADIVGGWVRKSPKIC